MVIPRVTALLAALAASGCRVDHSYRAGMESPDALGRMLAVRQAGEARDPQAVPLLVDRLEDEDKAVRMFAILALERITGQRFGYDYTRPIETQTASIERWRQYAHNSEHLAQSQSRNGPNGRGAGTDGEGPALPAPVEPGVGP